MQVQPINGFNVSTLNYKGNPVLNLKNKFYNRRIGSTENVYNYANQVVKRTKYYFGDCIDCIQEFNPDKNIMTKFTQYRHTHNPSINFVMEFDPETGYKKKTTYYNGNFISKIKEYDGQRTEPVRIIRYMPDSDKISCVTDCITGETVYYNK